MPSAPSTLWCPCPLRPAAAATLHSLAVAELTPATTKVTPSQPHPQRPHLDLFLAKFSFSK